MPLKFFHCPDNQVRPIVQCIEKCPVYPERCLSLPTLYECGQDRIWKGTPSTTQLLSPTRLEYLKITHNYAISPEDRAFAILGNRSHYKLEVVAKKIGMIAEHKMDGEISGILDLLEPSNEYPDMFNINDYKTWASRAVVDELENIDGFEQIVVGNTTYQQNHYKLKVEENPLIKIHKLFVQVTVRDGGTASAYRNKIAWRLKRFPVPILPQEDIANYFFTKREMLLTALQNKELPPMCDYEGRWNGRRCRMNDNGTAFCEVMPFCLEGAKINKIKLEA